MLQATSISLNPLLHCKYDKLEEKLTYNCKQNRRKNTVDSFNIIVHFYKAHFYKALKSVHPNKKFIYIYIYSGCQRVDDDQ